MSDETRAAPASLRIAAVAILAALTFVIGYFVRVPLPATQGIFTLADIVIFFSAFAFGPFSAAVSGGAGTALIDLIGGTAPYAPISLLVHGLEGLVAGLIAVAARKDRMRVLWWAIAGAVGTVLMAGGYFLAEVVFFGGPGKAVTEVLPNIAQAVVGAVGGALLTIAVRRAYPPIQGMRW
jgi:uncharacterized membrane protein